MTAVRTRMLALFTALMLALPAAGMLGPRWFCEMMGRVMSSTCCCGSSSAADDEPDLAYAPKLESSSCCSLLERPQYSGIAMRELAAQVESMALPRVDTVALVIRRISDLPKPRRPIAARAPPATGPPLFLENCSILS